eukprot:2419313-Ditylum_brightwellii.AAC.1
MSKQQPLALAAHSRKKCSLTTVRKGYSPQTSSNGVDLENIKCGLCAAAADSAKHAKEVATHRTTKLAKKTEE